MLTPLYQFQCYYNTKYNRDKVYLLCWKRVQRACNNHYNSNEYLVFRPRHLDGIFCWVIFRKKVFRLLHEHNPPNFFISVITNQSSFERNYHGNRPTRFLFSHKKLRCVRVRETTEFSLLVHRSWCHLSSRTCFNRDLNIVGDYWPLTLTNWCFSRMSVKLDIQWWARCRILRYTCVYVYVYVYKMFCCH